MDSPAQNIHLYFGIAFVSASMAFIRKATKDWDRIFAIKEDRTPVLLSQSLRQKDCVKHFRNQDAMASQRCPDTIDIEEQIEQDRESE
jgi:hypothetical protein